MIIYYPNQYCNTLGLNLLMILLVSYILDNHYRLFVPINLVRRHNHVILLGNHYYSYHLQHPYNNHIYHILDILLFLKINNQIKIDSLVFHFFLLHIQEGQVHFFFFFFLLKTYHNLQAKHANHIKKSLIKPTIHKIKSTIVQTKIIR